MQEVDGAECRPRIAGSFGALEWGGLSEILDRMRANPSSDWRVADVETVCRTYGIRCASPSGGGSHFKVSHPSQREILTVPFRCPIKPVYIRKLVRFIDAMRGPMRKPDYSVLIEPLSEDEGGGFLATVPDLPGCMSDGDTREAAARNIEDAIACWLEEAKALGRDIPQPKQALRIG